MGTSLSAGDRQAHLRLGHLFLRETSNHLRALVHFVFPASWLTTGGNP